MKNVGSLLMISKKCQLPKMYDEIKEILDKIKKCLIAGYDLDIIAQEEIGILWNYITNLQDENEELKNKLDNVKASYETEAEAKYYEYIDKYESKLQDRINKAIEYIKFNLDKNEELIEYFNWDGNFNKLLDILQGENNENNV